MLVLLWCNFKTSKRNSINLLATRWRLISHCKTSNYMYTLNCYKHRLIARLLARRTTFARGCNVSVSKSNFMLTGHLYCTFRLRELTRKTHSTNLLASALEFGLVRAPRRNKTDTLPRVFCPVFAPCHMYVLVCTSTYVYNVHWSRSKWHFAHERRWKPIANSHHLQSNGPWAVVDTIGMVCLNSVPIDGVWHEISNQTMGDLFPPSKQPIRGQKVRKKK